jgi:hypothetical protein
LAVVVPVMVWPKKFSNGFIDAEVEPVFVVRECLEEALSVQKESSLYIAIEEWAPATSLDVLELVFLELSVPVLRAMAALTKNPQITRATINKFATRIRV